MGEKHLGIAADLMLVRAQQCPAVSKEESITAVNSKPTRMPIRCEIIPLPKQCWAQCCSCDLAGCGCCTSDPRELNRTKCKAVEAMRAA